MKKFNLIVVFEILAKFIFYGLKIIELILNSTWLIVEQENVRNL